MEGAERLFEAVRAPPQVASRGYQETRGICGHPILWISLKSAGLPAIWACGKTRVWKNFVGGTDAISMGRSIMFAHENSGSMHWPRARDRLKCSTCTDAMVAPEASVLEIDGNVSYLWSCDICGQSFVTQASTLIFFNRPHEA